MKNLALGLLNGVRIYESPYVVEAVREPKKIPRLRKWRSIAKLTRLVKKWQKRYGLLPPKPGLMYSEIHHAYFAHPQIATQLRDALVREQTIQKYRSEPLIGMYA